MATKAFQMRSLQKDVGNAGTAEALVSTKLFAKGNVFIQAPSANTNPMFLGDSTVDAATGYILEPGDSVSLKDIVGATGDDIAAYDLNLVFVDATTNSEKVSVLYFEEA